MAGFTPNEAEAMVGRYLYQRILTDRDANLELGLFTNVAPDETITEAAITEPTGTGYARKTLTDASWTGPNDVWTYAKQTWTGGAGGWAGQVQGYFIATITAGGTQRCLHIEIDSSGPYTVGEGDTYEVTPSNTVV